MSALIGLPAPELVRTAVETALASAAIAAAALDPTGKPQAVVSAQVRELVAALEAASSSPSDEPVVLPAAVAAALARLRAVSLPLEKLDRSASAARIKLPFEFGEITAMRAERVTVGPRVLGPALLVPSMMTLPPTSGVLGTVAAASIGAAVETQMRDQLVQSLRLQWSKGGGDATIELNPTVLGRVLVQVRVERGVVSATVQAETPLVRAWVTDHRDELNQSLAQHGLRLDRLEVAETPKESPTRDSARDPRQSPKDAARQRREGREGREHPTDTFELNDPQENV